VIKVGSDETAGDDNQWEVSRMNAMNFPNLRPYLIAVALALSLPANASLIMSAGTESANAGSTGNAFDFTLTNTGPSAVALGAFSLEVSVADSNVSATTATTLPYVFAGDSLFGPVISTSGPGQTLDASDICILCGGTIAAGSTVGLAHVLFDVSAGAPSELLTVSIIPFPSTSLSDQSGSNLAATLQNGTITIVGANPIPEPSTLVLISLPAFFLARKRLRSVGRRTLASQS
jgi:hypothetical protein